MSTQVSIITPIFNHEKFVSSCIDSVLAQSLSEWEQIIIDDGSTDESEEIVKRYRDNRIRYFKQDNQGVERLAMTYNRALSQAHGEIIAILEGDDLWPPEKLSRMISAFENPEVVLAYGEVLDIDVAGRLSKKLPRAYRDRTKLACSVLSNDPVGAATSFLLTLAGQSFIPPASVLIRRSTLESVGGFQYVPGQCSPDVPTFVKLSAEGKFAYFAEVVGFRRRHLGSATLQYLPVMSAAARNYALEACADPVLKLSKQQQDAIRENWDNAAHKTSFSLGRIALVNRQWKTARKQFRSSVRSFEGRTLVAAMLGWTFSWFHFDLEGLFKLAGRVPLSNDRTLKCSSLPSRDSGRSGV